MLLKHSDLSKKKNQQERLVKRLLMNCCYFNGATRSRDCDLSGLYHVSCCFDLGNTGHTGLKAVDMCLGL